MLRLSRPAWLEKSLIFLCSDVRHFFTGNILLNMAVAEIIVSS